MKTEQILINVLSTLCATLVLGAVLILLSPTMDPAAMTQSIAHNLMPTIFPIG